MRLFAGMAVPGWAPVVFGLALVLLGQLLTTTLSFLLFVLGGRNTATFLPLRQYADYVEEVRTVSRNSGATVPLLSGSAAADDGCPRNIPRRPAGAAHSRA
jgi:hypothetical protein